MATPQDELRIQQEIAKIKERVSSLNQADSKYYERVLQTLMDSNAQLSEFEKLSQQVSDELRAAGAETDSLANTFRIIVGEIKKSTEGINQTTNAFRRLSSIAEQLSNFQKGYNDLSTKDLEKLQKKAAIEKERLKNAKEILETEYLDLVYKLQQAELEGAGKRTLDAIARRINENEKSQYQITEALSEQNGLLKDLNESFADNLRHAELIRKTMGLTGAAAGAFKGIIDKLGLGKLHEALGLDKAFEAATEKAKELTAERRKFLEQEKNALEKIKEYRNNKIENKSLQAALEAEINAEKGLFSMKQARRFGGQELRDKIKQLELLKEQELREEKLLEIEKRRLQEAQKFNDSYSLFNDRLKVLVTYFKEAGKGLLATLKDPLFYIHQIIAAFVDIDKGVGEFAKAMNTTYADAALLDQKFNSIANSSGEILVTTKGIRDTMIAMGQALGSNAILNDKDAVTFTKLRDMAGFTNDELVKMQSLTLATGGNLEDNTKTLLASAHITSINNKVLLNEKQIMKDIAASSAATKLSLAGNPALLGAAAAQAKALGMSLEQVNKIADSLLQIESSITSELEAELLLGKNLNLEGARLAALNNDMEGLSKEMAKNYGTAAEFSKINRIQQEAAAKAVGMSREELAGTLIQQEALRTMGKEQSEAAKAAFQARVAEVGLEKAQEEIKNGQLSKMMQQQSIQERLTASVEKMKELFVALVEPLMPLLDVLTSILGIVGHIVNAVTWLISLGGKLANMFLPAIETGEILGNILKGLIWAAGSAAAVFALLSLGPILGLAASGAILSLTNSLASKIKIKADDLLSPAGYGKRTITSPEGTIALNDKDTIVAGTNLFGDTGNIKSESKSETITNTNSTSNVNITPLVLEMQSIKSVLNQILAKEGYVYLDSTKVGTTLNVGSSKIQ